MTDTPLTPDERQAIEALPDEIAPTPGFEDRVVASLYRTGHLRRPGRIWLGRVAAALVIFATGYGSAWLPRAMAEGDGRGRFLLLLYGGDTTTAEAEAARVQEYGAWMRTETSNGAAVVAGERLQDEPLVLGQTDGAPLRQPAGYFVIRAVDATEAATIAARCPHLKYGGTVVVRRIG